MLNMFYAGKLKGMPPKLRSDDGKHIVIRPLAYVPEKLLERYAADSFDVIPSRAFVLTENKTKETS